MVIADQYGFKLDMPIVIRMDKQIVRSGNLDNDVRNPCMIRGALVPTDAVATASVG